MDFHRAGACSAQRPLVLLSIPASAIVAEQRARGGQAGARRHQGDSSPTTLDTLAKVERRLDQLESARRPLPPPAPSGPRIAPVNADNPAISFVVDTTVAVRHARPRAGTSRSSSGELFISAPIDPFLRGYAAINGSSEEGFDIEEAALVTTALPWNLTVKGGRFFADVGRFPHWHDERCPSWIARPRSTA